MAETTILVFRWVAPALFLAGLVACGSDASHGMLGALYTLPDQDAPGDGDNVDPGGSSNGKGKQACEPSSGTYPAGPYGTAVGDTIDNWKWTDAYLDPDNHCKKHSDKSTKFADGATVSMSDWYRGSEPKDGAWQSKTELRLLAVAAWSAESDALLHQLRDDYGNGNVDDLTGIVVVLVDTHTEGEAPSGDELKSWAQTLDLPMPVVADSNHAFKSAFQLSKFPAEVKVNPLNMSILDVPEPEVVGCTPRGQYPDGPHGGKKGNTSPNMTLKGFIDPDHHCKVHTAKQLDVENYADISLGDWYVKSRPSSSQVTVKRKLMIIVSTAWCGPCRSEAKTVAKKYRKGDVHEALDVVQVLIEDSNHRPATAETLKSWAKKYGITFPVLADPTRSLKKVFNIRGFPTFIEIDPRTMEVTEID